MRRRRPRVPWSGATNRSPAPSQRARSASTASSTRRGSPHKPSPHTKARTKSAKPRTRRTASSSVGTKAGVLSSTTTSNSAFRYTNSASLRHAAAGDASTHPNMQAEPKAMHFSQRLAEMAQPKFDGYATFVESLDPNAGHGAADWSMFSDKECNPAPREVAQPGPERLPELHAAHAKKDEFLEAWAERLPVTQVHRDQYWPEGVPEDLPVQAEYEQAARAGMRAFERQKKKLLESYRPEMLRQRAPARPVSAAVRTGSYMKPTQSSLRRSRSSGRLPVRVNRARAGAPKVVRDKNDMMHTLRNVAIVGAERLEKDENLQRTVNAWAESDQPIDEIQADAEVSAARKQVAVDADELKGVLDRMQIELSELEVDALHSHLASKRRGRVTRKAIVEWMRSSADRNTSGGADPGSSAVVQGMAQSSRAMTHIFKRVRENMRNKYGTCARAMVHVDPFKAGELSYDECRAQLHSLHIGLSSSEIDAMICAVDQDSTGVVDVRELGKQVALADNPHIGRNNRSLPHNRPTALDEEYELAHPPARRVHRVYKDSPHGAHSGYKPKVNQTYHEFFHPRGTTEAALAVAENRLRATQDQITPLLEPEADVAANMYAAPEERFAQGRDHRLATAKKDKARKQIRTAKRMIQMRRNQQRQFELSRSAVDPWVERLKVVRAKHERKKRWLDSVRNRQYYSNRMRLTSNTSTDPNNLTELDYA